MSLDQELPRLFEELAANHDVGPPPTLNRSDIELTANVHARRGPMLLLAAAAILAVLVGGLVAIASRDGDSVPATVAATRPELSRETNPAPVSNSGLDLLGIDATSVEQGTTSVVLLLDDELPMNTAVVLEDPSAPPADSIGYATQSADSRTATVCGNGHSFPLPGNQIVDIYIPSKWLLSPGSVDPPLAWGPDSGAPSKIIVCEPQNGMTQISIWGAASDRLEDVSVEVSGRTITVDIAPKPAAPEEIVVSETIFGPPQTVPADYVEIPYEEIEAVSQATSGRRTVAIDRAADGTVTWWMTAWSGTTTSGVPVVCRATSANGRSCGPDNYELTHPVQINGFATEPIPSVTLLTSAEVVAVTVSVNGADPVGVSVVDLETESGQQAAGLTLPDVSEGDTVTFRSELSDGTTYNFEIAWPAPLDGPSPMLPEDVAEPTPASYPPTNALNQIYAPLELLEE